MISNDSFSQYQEPIQNLKSSLLNTVELLKKDRQQVNSYFQEIGTNTNEIISNIKKTIENITKADNYLRQNKRSSQEPILNELFSFLINIMNQQKIEDITDNKKKAIKYIQIQSKMSVVPQFLQSALKMEPDITTEKLQTYPQVLKKTVLVQNDLAQKTKTEEQYRDLQKMMRITTSSVITQHRSNYCFFQKIIFGLSFPRFLIAQDECLLRCYSLWRKPNIQMLNNVWNLPQKGAIKHCKGITYQSITTSFHIHIPSKPKNKKLLGTYNIFEENNDDQTIKVLVLHHQKLDYKDQRYQPCSCCPCIGTNVQQIQTIMIHLHGGGFVALSSTTMQSYTRRWAKELKIPIFSIDYRKPPQFKFPTAVHDSLVVYEFLIAHIQNYFNIKPKRIILAGDSAGGNLACSLQALILKKNLIPKPIGIFLAYPAVDVRQMYTPSRLNSFNDSILFPTLLLMCQKQYLGTNQKTQFDPLASPILLNEGYIKGKDKQDDRWPLQWPKTTIMVGKKDPLLDDSLRLIERLVKGGIDAKIYLYKDFSHAFLSLDMVVSQCNQAITTSIEELRELIQGKN